MKRDLFIPIGSVFDSAALGSDMGTFGIEFTDPGTQRDPAMASGLIRLGDDTEYFGGADRLLGCGRVSGRLGGGGRSVGPRTTVTEDGDAVSEWTVQVTAIEEFVDSGAGR
ncbi:hypothetical protein [Nocardia tengchongensis]|uniref:hypothetical protein n=1 Tax=Nocardia tengchongensis TaxID=2055889 RepID=UPI0036B718E5